MTNTNDSSSSSAPDTTEEFCLFPQDGYLLIRIFGTLTPNGYNQLVTQLQDLQNSRSLHIIFDCGSVSSLHPLWARMWVQSAKNIESQEKKVKVVNVNSAMLASIKSMGLDSSFVPCATLRDALRDLNLRPKVQKFDVELVNPFIVSTKNTIDVQTNTISKFGTIFSRDPLTEFLGDLNAVIPLQYPNFRGVFIVSFPQSTILSLSTKILGSPIKEVSKLVQGVVGEIANISFTGGKKILNEKGYALEAAVPQLSPGKILPPEYYSYNTAPIVVPFDGDFGKYFIEIRIAA